ncbi:MAG: sigma factor-like helix-turn-helix DNA-binding protein, partial [Parvularcula sp.]|nr:sigma factor-like helix-turn-helix DNA-binding protein [Parvularcula sp.]
LDGAFKRLLRHFEQVDPDADLSFGQPPRSFIARFSALPFHQRAAFALVVIEELSVEEAAAIMELEESDIRALLLASREYLFANQWTMRSDA